MKTGICRGLFSGLLSPVTDLNLRRLEGGAELRFVANGNWNWTAGAGVIGRKISKRKHWVAGECCFFLHKQYFDGSLAGNRPHTLRVPERRFNLQGSFESRFGRGFKDQLGPFGSLGGTVRGKWMPHARGDDDLVQFRIRTQTCLEKCRSTSCSNSAWIAIPRCGCAATALRLTEGKAAPRLGGAIC